MSFGGLMMLLWQLTITSEMIGLEANIAMEVILMIANIQTLGVPVRYSSIPGTVAAAAGVFLIPCLGFVLDRWAKSKQSKAKILAFTTTIHLVGSLLVLLANGIKLGMSLGSDSSGGNGTSGDNLTNFLLLQIKTQTGFNSTSLKIPPDWNNTVSVIPDSIITREGEYNYSDYFQSQQKLLNQSSLTHSETAFPFNNPYNISVHVPFATLNTSMEKARTFYKEEIPRNFSVAQASEETIPFYAYIGMVGYTLLDCGYDSSNCFLKTFVLHCTPVEYHVSVIVKSIMVSSVGGVLVSILGSLDLGQILTAGTGLDSSSALACLVSALSNLLLVSGALATFICGFCWRPPFYKSDDAYSKYDEKSQLVISRSEGQGRRQNSHAHSSRVSKKATNQSFSESKFLASTSMTLERDQEVDAARLDEASLPGIRSFIQRQKKQILVNMSAFFLLSSLYSFEVFVVNFLGTRVFRGDPAAPSDSDDYHRYLDGVATGSQGTMIYYITFAVTSLLHEKSLALFGWKKESLFTAVVYAILCMASAITEQLWLFYVVSVWTGVFRAVSVSVPYILANQISAEQNGGKSSGTAIALVAAMLPCGFLVCSALMGPLIDATGNASISMYYSGVCAFSGCITIALLKV
ncbi:hypothetical protein EGW08_009820 [Elysia chlorotica]|uniref:Major facilitator superfamily (MFS) profile domain-containing protein n=1 Tax=Elysia chlorotica TaxID=188477 RepID=A0A433TLH7_ELYCH|nr:hypothetical protein EGW08_009820 [Elysia chlorotica]